eukprot:TRINITY_DN12290_c0_g1_i3.p1 TRINITY_DN12290_c0_g1~~TRINITY_DN12290_c0_g1_i3.p1  ORF type:complete len:218 (+),score=24.07 TRINITY_DN12290_c0_g1_i3:118-771(+)
MGRIEIKGNIENVMENRISVQALPPPPPGYGGALSHVDLPYPEKPGDYKKIKSQPLRLPGSSYKPFDILDPNTKTLQMEREPIRFLCWKVPAQRAALYIIASDICFLLLGLPAFLILLGFSSVTVYSVWNLKWSRVRTCYLLVKTLSIMLMIFSSGLIAYNGFGSLESSLISHESETLLLPQAIIGATFGIIQVYLLWVLRRAFILLDRAQELAWSW